MVIDDADMARLTALRAASVRGDGMAVAVGVAAIVIGELTIVMLLGSRASFWFWVHAVAVACVVLASLCLVVAERRTEPDDAALVGQWLPRARQIGVVFDLTEIASPWVWLPLAGPVLAGFIYLLYAWYLAVMAMFSNDDQGDARVGLLGVPISLAGYVLAHHNALALPLAILFIAAGGTLTFFERARRRALTDGFLLRIAGERAATDLLARLDALAAPSSSPNPGIALAPAEAKAILTPRQFEVLRQVARGYSNKQIARELNISPATVKVHVAQILAMTGSGNRTAAAVTMMRQG